MEHNILSALHGMFNSVKDINRHVQRLSRETRAIRPEVEELRRDIQTIQSGTGNIRQEAVGIRNLIPEVTEGRRFGRDEDQGSYETGEGSHHGLDGYDAENDRSLRRFRAEQWGDERSFREQVFEPLDGPSNNARGWNESVVSSTNVSEDSSGNDDDFRYNDESVSDAIERVLEAELLEANPEVKLKDPKNMKASDDYHYDGFRADTVRIEEGATKFNQLPADALSKLDNEVRINPTSPAGS
jgi:hypothetical protein